MRFRVGFQASLVLLGGLTLGACTIDRAGLEPITGGGSGAGSGAGSGVTLGTGGAVAPGGQVGSSGGQSGTGGEVGSGGSTPGSGGVTGTGGGIGSCNVSNCPDGCCMGSRCVTGGNDLRCGNAGAVCAACPSCYRCSDNHACEVDPASTWNLICASATISPTKPMNIPWDAPAPGTNQQPDPYCQFVSNGSPQARTTTVLNTTMPVWNQSITPAGVTAERLASQSDRWEVGLVDEDTGLMTVDPICSVAPHLTAADFAAGTVALPVSSPNCSSLTIQLVCAQ